MCEKRCAFQRIKRCFLKGVVLVPLMVFSCQSSEGDSYLVENYPEWARQYFIASSFEGGNQVVGKWNKKSVSFSIEGFSDKNRDFIKATFYNLSLLKNLPLFMAVDNEADISIRMPSSEVDFINSHTLRQDLRGFTDFVKDKSGYFRTVRIGINPKQSDQNIQISLHHEIMHALGFLGHPDVDVKESSVLGVRYLGKMDPENKISPIFPQIDQRCLELLYEERMPIIIYRKQAEIFLGLN